MNSRLTPGRYFRYDASVIRGVALSIVVYACAVGAGEVAGRARFWSGLGYDSNAQRVWRSSANDPMMTAGEFWSGVLSLDGQWSKKSFYLLGQYESGGRVFLQSIPDANTFSQSASLDLGLQIFPTWSTGFEFKARDRRGNARSYSDLEGHAYSEFVIGNDVLLRFFAGAHRFVYWPLADVNYGSWNAGASVRYSFSRKHSVGFSGVYEPRQYGPWAIDRSGMTLSTRRQDSMMGFGANYNYSGPWKFQMQYQYSNVSSNSFGETYQRHRVEATAGVRLPWKWMLIGSAAVQFSVFPDDAAKTPDVLLLNEDDNFDSVSLKLVRRLGEHFEVDLRYGFYFDRVLGGSVDVRIYQRHVVSAGVAVVF